MGIKFSESGTIIFNSKLLNALPCNRLCSSPEVEILPKVSSAQGKILIKGEQHSYHMYMVEHLTIDFLDHYHM